MVFYGFSLVGDSAFEVGSGLAGFYWVLLGFTSFYWVLPSFVGLSLVF